MSFNPDQFRELVIRPTLKYLEPEIPYSEEAEDLLFMTAAHESRLGSYLKQINGPALGVYQMEPDTHADIWVNFLEYRDELAWLLDDLLSDRLDENYPDSLVFDLRYATAMARVHYFRVKEALPKKDKFSTYASYLKALSEYAKKYYNTELGKATADDYYKAFLTYKGL